MTTKDLREKYGASSGRQAINRAIRAELAGGNEALDGLEEMHQAVRGRRRPEAGRALNALRDVVNAMEAEIRRRYGLPLL